MSFFAPVRSFTPLLSRVAPAARHVDPLFERFVNEVFSGSGYGPGFQLQQDDKSWTITLDLPGVAREDLAIDVEGPVVRVQTRAEARRQFKAAYELPQDIDAEATSAKLENGVLTLTLGKKQPVSNARAIQVQ
jgi:HSP20 family molecular chaperone IbpA